MKTQSGFTLMNVSEFPEWLKKQEVSRMVNIIQNHHTYIPNYGHFKGNNHFDLLAAMRNYHVGHNGWSDIAQNLTTFPDGSIATGRPLQAVPVGIKGHNAQGICIEHVGNFDSGMDTMSPAQRKTILIVNAALCQKFNLTPSISSIVYHHWFDLNTSVRTGGSGITKSCPGTAFFGGNTESAAENNFIPFVRSALLKLKNEPTSPVLDTLQSLFYYHVTASNLNVRTGPGTNFKSTGTIHNGSIVPVFRVEGQWFLIDPAGRWVSSKFGLLLGRAKINAKVLNVRSGPGTNYEVVTTLKKDDEIFLLAEEGSWAKIAVSEQWVHTNFLNITKKIPNLNNSKTSINV